MDPKAQSPHFEINVRVHDQQHYRIALNAESRNGSDVLVYGDQNFKNDNRVNGDGALFFQFSDGTTTAIFVKFQGQATGTDNKTGDPAVAIPVVAGQPGH